MTTTRCMTVLPDTLPKWSDIEILAAHATDPQRSSEPYINAYNANSLPFLLPIPSDEPTDNPEIPIVVDERAKALRAPVKKSKQKTAAIKRDSIPEALKSPRGTVIPRFDSANSRLPLDLPLEAATTNLPDVVINAGGPVFALDWCPLLPEANGSEPGRQYLAVGAHPKGLEMNPIGKRTASPGVLQIWEVQHEPIAPAKKAELPKLALGICHDRGILWDVKWCPNSAANGKVGAFKTLGYLAVVYGDGQIDVLAVPKPDSLAPEAGSPPASKRARTATSNTRFLRLKPQATASTCDVGCLGSCIDWLPTLPHNQLLVGTWEGAVIVYNIPPTPRFSDDVPQLERISHIQADMLPLRHVAWAPVLSPEDDHGTCHKRIFCTAGHSSAFKIWDYRDPFQPVLEVLTFNAWILGADWLASPPGALLVQDDGSLRWMTLNPYVRPKHELKTQSSWWGGTNGAIWSCHASPISGHTAYAGDGGEVVVAPAGFQSKSRARPPHIVVSSTRYVDRVICMMGQEPPREAVGNKLPVVKGDITNPSAAIYKVRWSSIKVDDQKGTWLASGGASGFVRCQRVSFFATF